MEFFFTPCQREICEFFHKDVNLLSGICGKIILFHIFYYTSLDRLTPTTTWRDLSRDQ